ncbi:hypothetical protein [Cohnella hongkongensis]|uniref:Uncharacterized protein n=1 Tax=Cohnella hongkongensis TaxID=178337 RepID=A0ABV9F713_9BACL
MQAYRLAYAASGVWLIALSVWLSDYRRYRALSIETWGFILVEALTLLPVFLVLILAELWRKRKSGGVRDRP